MGLFSRLFGGGSDRTTPQPEHAVIITFHYGTTDLAPLFEIEDKLRTAIDGAGLGEYDGHEVATDGSDGTLYMYGPSADALFEAALPVLETAPFMQGATAKLRYGPPEAGVKQIERRISA
jgi:hypothetical protein